MSNNSDYHKEYYQKNKEKIKERAKQWKKDNKEKHSEHCKKYRETHKEAVKKNMEDFKAKHNWSEYTVNSRKRRFERLKAEGVKNAWDVILKKAEPIFEEVEDED